MTPGSRRRDQAIDHVGPGNCRSAGTARFFDAARALRRRSCTRRAPSAAASCRAFCASSAEQRSFVTVPLYDHPRFLCSLVELSAARRQQFGRSTAAGRPSDSRYHSSTQTRAQHEHKRDSTRFIAGAQYESSLSRAVKQMTEAHSPRCCKPPTYSTCSPPTAPSAPRKPASVGSLRPWKSRCSC